MRRQRAILLAASLPVLVASACGGKVVLDVTGTGSSSSSSSGMGGTSFASTSFSSVDGIGGFGPGGFGPGGFGTGTDFVASSTVNDAVSTTTGTGGQTQICNSGASTGIPACDACLGQDCCAQITGCIEDMTCFDCLMSSMPSMQCTTDALYQAVTACFPQCNAECSG